VSTPDGSLTAVVQTGGKQYRVAPGDRILVDRLSAEPGAEIALDRVLLVADGGSVEVGTPTVNGVAVSARVLRHQRGPKIAVLRYKSKKRVRVHRGARADLTAIEVLDIGGRLAAKASEAAPAMTAAAKSEKAPRPPRAAKVAKVEKPVEAVAEEEETSDGA